MSNDDRDRGNRTPRIKSSRWVPPWPRRLIVGVLLVLAPLALMTYKIHRAGYGLRTLAPIERYRVALNMSFVGHGDSLRVRTFLPQQDARVTIVNESQESGLPSYIERSIEGNRVAEWSGQNVTGPSQIRVEFIASATARTYNIDRDILIPGPAGLHAGPDLAETPTIQVQDPEIATLAERLAPAGTPLIEGLRAIQKYSEGLRTVAFKGETDALTALRVGEASCNGKSRLFVALARHQGIEARLVGGLILEEGSKRTSHQWVEVQVGPYWVPFCPTNHYFAEVPIHYLELYRGDEALFKHSSDINFDYRFHIREEMVPRKELVAQGERDPLNLLSMWSAFHKAGIPDSLLKVLLMIPLGALVLVIFRNVIGLQTYGTFLPVLIAVASREIGLFWGVLVFLLIIAIVFCARALISRMNLLHMPQMAILLTVTIAAILGLAVTGVRAGNRNLSDVSMFPIAILAITTERMALMLEETGIVDTLKMIAMTAICIAGCYFVMNAATFQILFMSFPELVLIVLFLDIWIGHWMGLRLLEYWRFRRLLEPGTRAR